jgi:hypothetical protein
VLDGESEFGLGTFVSGWGRLVAWEVKSGFGLLREFFRKVLEQLKC